MPPPEPQLETPQPVLLVEDDEIMRLSLEDRLQIEGIPAISVATLAEARRVLAGREVDAIVTDVRLPDGSGRELFEEVRRHHAELPVILMTAYVSVPEAVALVKAGAVDYLTKPFDIELFVERVHRTLSEVADARRAALLAGPDGERFRPGSGVLGKSAAMRRIERLIARLATVDSSILITGESGVGKEVVAGLIHRNSRRAAGPFVAVNCAAISPHLVESELFGHERGAFTGADHRHIGRFERAQGGTVFLDEIAEIGPDIQVKLLRVLQERTIERVGGTSPVDLEIRVLAATQVDLAEAMREGRFRSDLYWRLNVIHIAIPPLRERPEDVVYLARLFVERHARAMGKQVTGLSTAAERALLAMPFPGNVRELANLMERAVALCTGPRVQAEDLLLFEARHAGAGDEPGAARSLKDTVAQAERAAILDALSGADGAVTRAAEALSISRKSLWEKMKRYGIAH